MVANMTGGGHDGCHDNPGRLVRPGPGADRRGHGEHARRRVPLRAGWRGADRVPGPVHPAPAGSSSRPAAVPSW